MIDTDERVTPGAGSAHFAVLRRPKKVPTASPGVTISFGRFMRHSAGIPTALMRLYERSRFPLCNNNLVQ